MSLLKLICRKDLLTVGRIITGKNSGRVAGGHRAVLLQVSSSRQLSQHLLQSHLSAGSSCYKGTKHVMIPLSPSHQPEGVGRKAVMSE